MFDEKLNKEITLIKEKNYKQYIGLGYIAFIDNLSDGVGDLMDGDCNRYRCFANLISREAFQELTPIPYDNINKDSIIDVEGDEAFFMPARKPCEGWYYCDLREGFMGRCRYLWYTDEIASLLKKNSRYINNLYKKADYYEQELLREDPLEMISRVIAHEREKRIRKNRPSM